MQFKNRPNQCVWISRSIVVLGIPFFQCQGYVYVPLSRRGNCGESGKFGLPSGYLDWDESVKEALVRAIYEKLGLNLYLLGKPYCGSIDQPCFVFSDPGKDAHQNVTLRFKFAYQASTLPDLAIATSETTEAQWFLVEDAIKMELAFNHADIIKESFI